FPTRRSSDIGVDMDTAAGKLALEDGLRGTLYQRARRRVPRAALGRVEPELQQDVVGFQGDVGGEGRAPVAVGTLFGEQPSGRGLRHLAGARNGCLLYGQDRAGHGAVLPLWIEVSPSSGGREKRTSSSTSPTSSS